MNKPTYKYLSPAGLGSFLSIMLMFNCLLIAVSIVISFVEINLLNRALNVGDVTLDELEANDSRNMMLGFFWIGFQIFIGVVFLKWIYRVSANAHVYSAGNMTYSAGWSVGWFFIPIMNLFRPYQAMKETWKVSAAGPEDDPSFDVAVPSIVPTWWALWIIGSISSRVAFRLNMEAVTYEDFINADYVSIVDYGLAFCLCLVALKMVADLTQIQTERGNVAYGSDESPACPECGQLLRASDESCPMCGASLNTASTEIEPNPFADLDPPADSNPFAG